MTICRFVALLAAQAAALTHSIAGMETTYEVLTEGAETARTVTPGTTVTVHATGAIAETGKKFWSTKDEPVQPFKYRAGLGGVIAGWDQGCLGMRVGEVRRLTIPAKEGYGEKGLEAWGIPPDGTLHFEIEVLEVLDPKPPKYTQKRKVQLEL